MNKKNNLIHQNDQQINPAFEPQSKRLKLTEHPKHISEWTKYLEGSNIPQILIFNLTIYNLDYTYKFLFD